MLSVSCRVATCPILSLYLIHTKGMGRLISYLHGTQVQASDVSEISIDRYVLIQKYTQMSCILMQCLPNNYNTSVIIPCIHYILDYYRQ